MPPISLRYYPLNIAIRRSWKSTCFKSTANDLRIGHAGDFRALIEKRIKLPESIIMQDQPVICVIQGKGTRHVGDCDPQPFFRAFFFRDVVANTNDATTCRPGFRNTEPPVTGKFQVKSLTCRIEMRSNPFCNPGTQFVRFNIRDQNTIIQTGTEHIFITQPEQTVEFLQMREVLHDLVIIQNDTVFTIV